MISTIERAERYLAKCPPAIMNQGGSNAAYHAAAVLVQGFALGEAEAMTALRRWNTSCVPPWSEAELLHKVQSAAHASQTRPRGYLLGGKPAGRTSPNSLPRLEKVMLPPKPEFKPDTLKRVAAKTSAINDVLRFLIERSPVRVDTQNSASVLRRLYPYGSGEKVLLFTDMQSQGQFVWEANRSDVIQNPHLPTGAEGVWFLPQPVDGEFHVNPRMEGKMSRRSEEAVTSWRYVVLESDKADKDDWLRCLVQLPLRIACICDSGGRSIHALARVDAASKLDWDARVRAVKPILITLGADSGALSAVRLSRLPQARRGARGQKLFYLNTEPNGRPILEQPTQEVLYGRKWYGEAASGEDMAGE